MAAKPDVRVRAHTTYSVDVYDAPRTTQMADGLGMTQANAIAEAMAGHHEGGHVRMTGSTTSYPVENVPTHLGPLYQELVSLPAGAEFHFRLQRNKADAPPVMYLERIIPEVVEAGEQPTAEKIGLHIDTTKLREMIQREMSGLKPALADLANDSSIREVRQAMEKALKDTHDSLPTEDDIESFVDKVREKTGKAKGDLRRWAYESLGDRLGEIPIADRKRELYCHYRAQGLAPVSSMHNAGYTVTTTTKADDLEENLHVKARIAYIIKTVTVQEAD